MKPITREINGKVYQLDAIGESPAILGLVQQAYGYPTDMWQITQVRRLEFAVGVIFFDKYCLWLETRNKK